MLTPQPYPTIEDALDALADYLSDPFGGSDDPHVVRVVLRSGEELEATVKKANTSEITLTGLPPRGASRRIPAADITELAVAMPAPGRWIKVALWTVIIGVGFIWEVALLRQRLRWLDLGAVTFLMCIVGAAAMARWRRTDQPGSSLLPWVVTFRERSE